MKLAKLSFDDTHPSLAVRHFLCVLATRMNLARQIAAFLFISVFATTSARATCNGSPSTQALISGPSDVGLFSGTIQYNFPDSPRTLEYWLDTPNGVVYTHPVIHDAQGSIDFAQNTSCWPEGAYRLRIKATSCDGISTESSAELNVPSQQPVVSVTIDRSNPASPVGTVHYEFPFNAGAGAFLFVEWLPSHAQILYNNSGLGNSGERTFTISGCVSPGRENIRVTAGVCNFRTSAQASPVSDFPQPQLDLSVKKGAANANGGRDATGLLTWSLPPETPSGTLTIKRLPWTNADGQTYPAATISGPSSIGASGAMEISIPSPSPGQQVTLEALVETCSAHAVRDVANDCPLCEGSGNPVSYSDGNMRLADTDPLPPIGTHSLIRTYNSDEQVVGSFGRGWTTMFDRRLMVNTDTWADTVSIVNKANDVVMFRGYAGEYAQTFPLKDTQLGTLQRDSTAGTYTYRAGGATETAVFRMSDGRLIALRDLTTGREAQFAYDTQGRPQTLTDSWSGIAWTFTLDAQHRVASITAGTVGSRLDVHIRQQLQPHHRHRARHPAVANLRIRLQSHDRIPRRSRQSDREPRLRQRRPREELDGRHRRDSDDRIRHSSREFARHDHARDREEHPRHGLCDTSRGWRVENGARHRRLQRMRYARPDARPRHARPRDTRAGSGRLCDDA